MAKKRTGSPKNQPKPLRRFLDPLFQERLKEAIGAMKPEPRIEALADMAGCERQTLYAYRNGKRKVPEAFLILALSDVLGVSFRWLLTGDGDRDLRQRAVAGHILIPDRRRQERRANGGEPA